MKFFCKYFWSTIVLIKLVFANTLLYGQLNPELDKASKFRNPDLLIEEFKRIGIPNAKLEELQKLGIQSHADFFLKPYIVKDILTPKQLNLVKQTSVTYLLTDNETLQQNLIKEKFNSIVDLGRYSPKEIVKLSGNELTLEEANQFVNKVGQASSVGTFTYNRAVVENRNNSVFGTSAGAFAEKERIEALLNSRFNSPQNGCLECEESNSIFSPGVYSLYLLDFVSKVFPEDFWELDELNKRFYQRLEDVPIFQDLEESGSYIKYANEILENYLSEKLASGNTDVYDVWPNRLQEEMFTLVYSLPVEEWSRSTYPKKHEIYKQFLTSPKVPHPNLVEELFDAYVNELGTNRTDVEIALLGNDDFQTHFAERLNLKVEDLNKINKEVQENGRNQLTIVEAAEIKGVLWGFFQREVDTLLHREYALKYAKYADKDFTKFFNKLIREKSEEIIKCYFNSFTAPPSAEELDSLLLVVRGNARSCITQGTLCPEAENCNALATIDVPLYRLQALFQQYARYYNQKLKYPDSINFAKAKLTETRRMLEQEEIQRLSKIMDVSSLSPKDKLKLKNDVEEKLRSPIFFEKQLEILGKLMLNWEKSQSLEFREALYQKRYERTSELYREAINRAEKGFHFKLRENLIHLAIQQDSFLQGLGLKSKAVDRLSNFLFLDLSIIEDFQTTPIAFTISRLHTLLQAAELGTARKTLNNDEFYDTSILENETWNQRWEWMQSYSIFHAAMMVSLYPENYISHTLRGNYSKHYQKLVDEQVNQVKLYEYWREVNDLNNMWPLGMFKFQDRIFFIAAHSTNEINFSILERDGTWIPWLADPIKLGNFDTYSRGGGLSFPIEKLKLVKYENGSIFHLVFIERLPKDRRTPTWVASFDIKLDKITKINEDWLRIENGPVVPTSEKLFVNSGVGLQNRFAVGGVNPKEVRGKILISEKAVPHVYYQVFEVGDNEVETVEFDTIKSKEYDNILGVFASPNSPDLLWFAEGTQQDYLISTEDYKEIPYEIPENTKRTNYNINDIDTYFTEAGRFFYSKSMNKIISYENENNEIDVVGTSIIAGITQYKNQRIFFGKDDTSGALFYTNDPSTRENRNYLTEPNLSQIIKDEEYSIYDDNIVEGPASMYNEEAMLHIPMYMANLNEEIENYEEASSWLSRIINYSGLDSPEGHPLFDLNNSALRNAGKWLDEPFKPYSTPNFNKSVYWSKVKIWHAENLVSWADKQFQIDNAESVNRARELYELALKVLQLGGESANDSCALARYDFYENLIKRQDPGLRLGLGSKFISASSNYIFEADNVLGLSLSDIAKQTVVETGLSSSKDDQLILDSLLTRDQKYQAILSEDSEFQAINSLLNAQDNFSIASYLMPNSVFNDTSEDNSSTEIITARGKILDEQTNSSLPGVEIKVKDGPQGTISNIDGDFSIQVSKNMTLVFSSVGYFDEEILVQDSNLWTILLSPIPERNPNEIDIADQAVVFELKPFCLPRNPKFKTLFWRIQSNLEKIRTSRNFAGFQRQLPHYAIPIDPERIIGARAAGNANYSQFLGNKQIPFFRYSFLSERARNLARLAQQFEGTLLNVIISKENAELQIEYDIMKARQDVQLQEANLSVQNLRVAEAYDMQRQAAAQYERTEVQFNHYDNLIDEGLNSWEKSALTQQYASATAYATSSLIGSLTNWATLDFASGINMAGNAAGALGSAFQQEASYERREEEWRFQRRLSNSDQKIAEIGIDVAQDRYDIMVLERSMNALQYSFANDQLTYFNKKDKVQGEVYEWMHKHLKRMYKEQLGMAIGAARTAQQALEFQQQTTLDFIGYDYSKYTRNEDGFGERHLGAEKLLQDIEKLESYRVNTTSRKKEIQKNISLSSVAPAEFQKFRETGVLEFETLMEWFDRDFPGHYMRLVNDIEVQVFGLIPPNQGIKATLSNDGFSRIMVNPSADEPALVYKYPESIALSGASGGNGLFTLRPDDVLLYPFEGNGVAARWRFEMPKGANPIDFNTIADIIFTLRYTAKEDRGYRQRVLKKMDQDEAGYVTINSRKYFSLRNDFPDQWFLFKNPNCGLAAEAYNDPIEQDAIDPDKVLIPNTMILDLTPADFLPNEEDKKISRVTLAVQLADSIEYLDQEDKTLKFNLKLNVDSNRGVKVRNLQIKDFYISTLKFNTVPPYGSWIIQLNQSCADNTLKIKPEHIEDILLVLDYEAKAHYNR